jgi:hypothetical protein
MHRAALKAWPHHLFLSSQRPREPATVFEGVGTADFDAAAVCAIMFMISARTVGTTPCGNLVSSGAHAPSSRRAK